MNRRDALKAVAGIPIVTHASVMDLRENDVIVLKVSHKLNDTERTRIYRDLLSVFGMSRKVVILDGGMDLGVLRG